MTRRPKTPTTGPHWTRWNWMSPVVFYDQYGRWRRQPKGKRRKSGQWWPREDAKKRAREHRKLFPDYFKGEAPQATYNPNGDQGAW